MLMTPLSIPSAEMHCSLKQSRIDDVPMSDGVEHFPQALEKGNGNETNSN
jgi:hypothetical protein